MYDSPKIKDISKSETRINYPDPETAERMYKLLSNARTNTGMFKYPGNIRMWYNPCTSFIIFRFSHVEDEICQKC